jgi:hypothetical protein
VHFDPYNLWRMATRTKSEQARVNGAKSKGPTTPEGKARSAAARTTHAAYAVNAIVLPHEDRASYDELRHHYLLRFDPVDQIEIDLVDQYVAAEWRLRRNAMVTTGLIWHEMELQRRYPEAVGNMPQTLTRMIQGHRSIADRSRLGRDLAAQEKMLHNLQDQIVARFLRLRTLLPANERTRQLMRTQDIPPATDPTQDPKMPPKSPAVPAKPPIHTVSPEKHRPIPNPPHLSPPMEQQR